MPRFALLLILTFFSCFTVVAQVNQQLEIRGDEAMRMGNYQTAWNYYNEAVKTDSVNLALWFKMGESARELFNYPLAYQCYRIVFERDRKGQYPLALFWMADLSRNMGDYHMARAYYLLFLEKDTIQAFYADKASEQVNRMDDVIGIVEDTARVATVEHLVFPVNSPFSEFAGFQFDDDRLFFTSVQPLLNDDGSGILGNGFLSSVYYSDFTPKGLTRPVLFAEPVNSRSEHTANLWMSPEGDEVWFNRCEMNSDYKYRCDIFYAKLLNGSWSKPEKLAINDPASTSTQPFFCTDTAGNELLYFSSDRSGGMGQLDIWYSVRKNGRYNAPVNAGSLINSPGNEITPFFDTLYGRLWFSSDWYYGMGGYDIYYSEGGMSAWNRPLNAGMPFNSPANDFYFCINSVDRDGYFTSNREGSYFFKGETCCNDLYAWYAGQPVRTDTLPDDTLPVEVNVLKERISELVPLDLYFHNDIPDPRSRDTVTMSSYDETFYAYTAMIDRYRKEYAKGLSGAEAEKAESEIEVFFMAYVTAGFRQLLELTPLLSEDLEAGSRVTLKIQGFCSPLTSTEYNINLAKRRICSVLNYFNLVDGGKLRPYIEGRAPNGGQLIVIQEPVGEALSAPWVSDNPNDMRNSVFSIAAARERRIQIVSYESDYAGSKVSKLNGPLLVISSSEIRFSLKNDSSLCARVTMTNAGDEELLVESVRSDQPWVNTKVDKMQLIPGNVTTLNVCIDRTMLKNPALGVLVITSNSRDKRSVVYVRVGE